MTEPITTQKSLIVPNTGDLSGAWGTSALNPNFQTIDALFGGLTTISLAGATTLALSVPATTGIWPGGSVSQSVNSLIRFTGAQTGSATIQFALPGFYIIENNCTGTTSIRLQPSNLTGNCIGAIPGKKCHVFFDGTHMDYLNQSDPGTAYDLHTNTSTLPPWMTVCTVAPYIWKNGDIFNSATYPALAATLGSTFGGNGVTTFGVPDERSRFRLAIDGQGAGATQRVTAISGVNATTMGASGGLAVSTMTTGNLPAYTPSGGVTGTTASLGSSLNFAGTGGAGFTDVVVGSGYTPTINATFSGNAQGGTSQTFPNIPPCIVSVLALIKT